MLLSYIQVHLYNFIKCIVWISFCQVSGSVFEDLIESRSKLNVSNIAKVSFTVNATDK